MPLRSRPSEVRLQELFRNPDYTGTDEEWDNAKNTVMQGPWLEMNGSPYITVVCPYCTWINEHGVGDGHRECDGPVMSMYGPRGGMRRGYKMYDCPGYTITTPAHDNKLAR